MKRSYDIMDGLYSDTVTLSINGKQVKAFRGETLLSLLFAYGDRAISKNDYGKISGAYCGMGICQLCTVQINGHYKQRACMTVVKEGMIVNTQTNLHFDSDLSIDKGK